MNPLRCPRPAWLAPVVCVLLAVAAAPAADEHPLLAVVADELKLSMDKLIGPEDTRPYFIQYAIADQYSLSVSATLGAVTDESESRQRVLDVEVRCGDYALDSTRQIRGAGGWDDAGRRGGYTLLPLNDDAAAVRHALWLRTDEEFKASVKRLAQVKANLAVKVEEEDKSDDFSREQPNVYVGPWVTQASDRAEWTARVRRAAERFRTHPLIFSSSVSLSGQATNTLAVNSEGSRIQHGRGWWRVGIQAATIADDGMELSQYTSFDAHSPDGLPSEEELSAAVDRVIADVLALRAAPLTEPYTGPAILMNRASGVFFHEIFGHRMEGHRQKDVEEGQTFAKKIGQPVLPDFLSVVDDPTQRTFSGIELNGCYAFDDECVPAQPALLVENGVLKTFLMSRTPARGFDKSNGHGRRQPGMPPVSRMGNTILKSDKRVSFATLREMLVAECRNQGKEFGLLFTDISGGFTMTQRYMPQSFKVQPILVYRVYADGRPDELVRGVDIVGTPLTSFSSILATADDEAVFNGVCGAESGAVPVSAISPSILVQQIEVEKKQKAQDRPPLLPAPIAAQAQ